MSKPEYTSSQVYADVVAGIQEIQSNEGLFYDQLGVAQTSLREVSISGPHQYLLLDESVQAGNNFKTNGASWAVHQTLERVKAEGQTLDTIVTASAGNWALSLAHVCEHQGLRLIANTPDSVTPAKAQPLIDMGVEVRPYYTLVEAGLADAEKYAHRHESAVFLHPYNNLYGMQGQAMVGQRVVNSLVSMEESEARTEILVQQGGGSLAAGVAIAVKHEQQQSGRLQNTVVRAVRPHPVNGEPHPRYDGLRVAEPGARAAAILNDTHFVQDTLYVDELHTALGANRLAWALHKRIEPAGMTGAAAFEQYAPDNHQPTRYVVIASGSNVTPDAYDHFRYVARDAQAALIGKNVQNSQPAMVLSNPTPSLRHTNYIVSSAVAGLRPSAA